MYCSVLDTGILDVILGIIYLLIAQNKIGFNSLNAGIHLKRHTYDDALIRKENRNYT